MGSLSNHVCRHERKQERRDRAQNRQLARQRRTDFEQSQILLDRPGHSFREMARLDVKGEE